MTSFELLWLCIMAYVFMRAFGVEFASSRDSRLYRIVSRIIAGLTLVSAGIAVVALLTHGLQVVRFTAKKVTPPAVQPVEADEQTQEAATNGAVPTS